MYVMNKNVEHNGKAYLKGQEIKPGDAGFDIIVKAGHADKSVEPSPAKMSSPEAEKSQASDESEDRPRMKGRSSRK